MSLVHLQSVDIINPQARFSDPYIIKITFECLADLQEDIEWKLVYVGSPNSEEYDQELDNCMVGPVPIGVNSFEFEAEAPSPSKLPQSEILGLTVILLTASYRDQEFIKVGYYVRTEYETQELIDDPPEKLDLSKVVRNILVDKPRVTRMNITWDESNQAAASAQPLLTNEAAGVPPPVKSMVGEASASASASLPSTNDQDPSTVSVSSSEAGATKKEADVSSNGKEVAVQ